MFEEPEDTEAAEERRERRRQGTELVRAFGAALAFRTLADPYLVTFVSALL